MTDKNLAGSELGFKTEDWDISRPIPYDNNPRLIPQAAIDKVAGSIEEFGFNQPIVVDAEDVIIVGHVRLLAAQKLGLETVPVYVANLTADQAKAYRLADNRTGEEAMWDMDKLAQELRELENSLELSEEFDFETIGFDALELDTLFAPEEEEQVEEIPEEPENPVSKEGDLWILGDHRLICGSSTDADTVTRLLDGETPHLMVTDPPYGINYDPGWRNIALQTTSDLALGKVLNDDIADWSEAWALFPGHVAYVYHAGTKAHIVADSLIKNDFTIKAQIIWAKDNFAIGRGDYHPKHEPCYYAVKDGHTHNYNGARDQTTVWNIKHEPLDTGHSTQKPVECMARPILNNSLRGDAVYEPFCGSGTTLIAAERHGRRCFAVELNPPYVDIIVKRWEQETGKTAILDGTGQTFEELSDQRLKETEDA